MTTNSPAPPRTRRQRALAVIGTLLIVAGLATGGYVAYEVLWTGHDYTVHQGELSHSLQEEWKALPPTSSPAGADPLSRRLGAPEVLLTIPRLSTTYVTVYGTDQPQLALGPGIYTSSPDPGQVGNFAIAGHRTTHGAPFFHLDELRSGDQIVLQTAHHRYVYVVYLSETVLPDFVAALAPVPDHPGAAPDGSYLTLSACTPFYSASHRLVVHAKLDPSLSS